MIRLIASFARNTVFANMALVLIVVGGLLALSQTVRETFPQVSLDSVLVRVIWPGADPEDVEDGITRKIEEAVADLDGVKQYTTYSAEGLSSTLIEVLRRYEVNDVMQDIRNAVDQVDTLPPDSETPVIEEVRTPLHVAFVALTGPSLTERELKEWAETVKDQLQAQPEISQVRVVNARSYEISIELSRHRLLEYGLTIDQVAEAVRASSLNLAGGTLRTRGEQIRLRTIGRKYSAQDFAGITVMAGPRGDRVTLDQIAEVRDTFEEGVVVSRFNGEPAAILEVLKTANQDTLTIDLRLRQYVEGVRPLLPPGTRMAIWGRSAIVLQNRISLLTNNGLMGLGLVLLFLWLVLDARLSFWAGMGIPTTLLGAFMVMWALGITINMISLFGLITVLGIIVDDAIVVGEAVYVARRDGTGPVEAAVRGVREVGRPVVAGVVTTMIAFVPLFFIGGYMGNLITVLPVVVITCLGISLVECLFLLPAHLAHGPGPASESPARWSGARFSRLVHGWIQGVLASFSERVYLPILYVAMHWRYATLGMGLLLILTSWGLIENGILKFQYFPDIDGNRINVRVEFPDGTPLDVTERAVHDVEAALSRVAAQMKIDSGKPLVENRFAMVGAGFHRVKGEATNSHVGAVWVELLGSEERGVPLDTIIARWEDEVGQIPGLSSLTFKGEDADIPGAAIEIWLQGTEYGSLLAAARELKGKLALYEGVYQIQDDFRTGKNELRVRLKPEARTLGITVADLARSINAGYYGTEAIRLQRGRDDVRVRVRYMADERVQQADFERMRVTTPMGFEVPVLSVAQIEKAPGFATITRTNGLRRVSVSAEVDSSVTNTNEIVRDLKTSFLEPFRRAHPDIRLVFRGDEKEMHESFDSLWVSAPLAAMAMFVLLAGMFRSYIQPLIILVIIPFGLVGAILGHLVLGYELSILSLFGMTALGGVVVNDAIIMMECINSHLQKGEVFFEAVVNSGARRFRAVILTTVTTVGGLTPLMLETDFQARVLIPMAISLAFGLAFATMVTLVLLPCLFHILNDLRRGCHRLIDGTWPLPEDVEPALRRTGSEMP